MKELAELGKYLGIKLDKVVEACKTQRIDINLGEASENIAAAAEELKEVAEVLKENEEARDFSVIADGVEKAAKATQTAAATIADAAKRLDMAPVKETNRLIGALITEARQNRPKDHQPTDLSGVVGGLNTLQDCIVALERTMKATNTNDILRSVLEGVKGIKLNVPGTIKLDDTQLRSLRTGASFNTGGALTPRNVTVTNVALTASNTEYSYIFPANTLGYTIKLRDQGTLLYYAWESGKMPSGGDSSAYMTAPQNFLRSIDGIEYSGKTIYLGAESNSQVAEIEVFTA